MIERGERVTRAELLSNQAGKLGRQAARLSEAAPRRWQRPGGILGRVGSRDRLARAPQPDLATDESVEPCLLGCQVAPLPSICLSERRFALHEPMCPFAMSV